MIKEEQDVRDTQAEDYDPKAALAECYDLWAAGAWRDDNAVYNLNEVMGQHVAHLVGRAPGSHVADSGSVELYVALILAAAVPTVLILVFVSMLLGSLSSVQS